jgi:C-terminal processing protease CtpA/Prc
MKCIRFILLAAVLASTTWLVSPTFGQEGESRRDQSQSQNDSERNRNQRNEQQSADDDELEYRGMEHAALGVMLGERTGQGVRIRDLLSGSPAERAGLRVGDRIQKIDDKQMKSYGDVIRFVNRVKPGQEAKITVNREGEEKTLEVRFASQEELYGKDSDEEWQHSQQQQGQRQQGYRQQRQNEYSTDDPYDRDTQYGYGQQRQNDRQRQLGPRQAQYQDDYGRDYSNQRRRNQNEHGQQYNQEEQNYDRTWRGYNQGQTVQRRQQQGMDSRQNAYGREGNWSNQQDRQRERNHGLLGIDMDDQRGAVVVRDVWSGSPAEQAGLRRGDEIISINDTDVEDQNDVIQELKNHQPGDRLSLTISRNGEERTVRARLASQWELSAQNQDRNRYQDNERRSNDDNYDRNPIRPRLRQALRGQGESYQYQER